MSRLSWHHLIGNSAVFASATLLKYLCLVGLPQDPLPGLGEKQLPPAFVSTGLLTHQHLCACPCLLTPRSSEPTLNHTWLGKATACPAGDAIHKTDPTNSGSSRSFTLTSFQIWRNVARLLQRVSIPNPHLPPEVRMNYTDFPLSPNISVYF